jgi:NADH dehydrogenase [ubiquinone] 1 alpha subcomplex assembly factor 7
MAFDLIELGPGRGTLMSDLLRAARALPDFISRVSVRLVETSPVFRDLQRRALSPATVPVTWHEDIDQLPPAPTLIIANEFFDALPVRQFQRLQEGWGERAVGVRDEKLALGLIPAALELPSWTSGAKEGEVAEISPTASHWGASIGRRLGGRPGAALIIDYGHVRSALGETLQAVRAHAPVPVLDRPGESDLTAHVDFQALGEAIRQSGGIVWPAMTQRDFLVGMGLDLRASMLARTASDAQKRDLLAAVERVAGPRQMGHLFKVQAATCPGLACPHPFAG